MKALTPDEKETVHLRLQAIADANGGRLTADDVVSDAKRKDSPLHAHFEWDTKKAAAAYWIEQARVLITSVRVVVTTETTKVSVVAYIRDPAAASDQQGYVATASVRKDVDVAREVLVAEFTRIGSMLRRARELAVVFEAQDEVDGLLQSVVGLRQRFEQPAAVQ